jgi:hypothetical protein
MSRAKDCLLFCLSGQRQNGALGYSGRRPQKNNGAVTTLVYISASCLACLLNESVCVLTNSVWILTTSSKFLAWPSLCTKANGAVMVFSRVAYKLLIHIRVEKTPT